MTYNCEVLRGAAGPNPLWIMGLQGGPNTYSGATNAGLEPCEIGLVVPDGLRSEALWGGAEIKDGGRKFSLGPRRTSVLLWSPRGND